MASKCIAIVVAEDERRFKVRNWMKGSRRTSDPKRPGTLLSMAPSELDWSLLDRWNAAVYRGKGFYTEGEDSDTLERAVERIERDYGATIAKIVYHDYSGDRLPKYHAETVN